MAILGTTESRPLGPPPTGSVGIEAGKHYTDPASGLELLCTHAGAGPIAADGRELILKDVIPL
jgi:hypothetical protein